MAHLYVILLRDTTRKNNFIFIKSWDSRNMEISGKKANCLSMLKAGRSEDPMMICQLGLAPRQNESSVDRRFN